MNPSGKHRGEAGQATTVGAESRTQPNASRAFLTCLAVLFAFLHAILALTATTKKSTTADEIAYLTAGQAYNQRADYRLHPENGILPQRWAALPLTVAGAPLPSPTLSTWKNADVWKYGYTFFYENGLSTDEFIFLGRGMIALISAATGLVVFFWSRALFGWRGAFLSLSLFVFCPAFLAHGALATSDVMMTFFFLASVGTWSRHLENPGWPRAILSAVVLGLAFVSKFSALLLPAMLALIALEWAVREGRKNGWRAPVARLVRTAALHVVVTWLVIWLFYGFRFAAFAPEFASDAQFNHPWPWILDGLGLPEKVIAALRDWRILPEAWLYGLAFVLGFSEARGAFLNGEYSLTGWVGFFPFAFLVKTTLPLIALITLGLVASARRTIATKGAVVIAGLRPFLPLVALFAVYGVTSLTSHLNIGHRHILPLYPVLLIGAGCLGRWLDFRRFYAAAVVSVLVGWHVVESVRIRPHYLAYFNQLVGGASNGWRHLVDSSLDWGQDLPLFVQWLRDHNSSDEIQLVFLSYFGTGEPDYEGINATRLPSLPVLSGTRRWAPLTAGIYGVSATMLQQVYSEQHEWSLPLEHEFQDLRAAEPLFFAFQNDPQRRARMLTDFPLDHWRRLWKRYDALRFARLCFYLRVRGPDAHAGYSILIFRLSDAEVSAATAGSLAEWQSLIEKTVTSRQR